MRKSNYDKQPATRIAGQLWKGWQAVRDEINRRCASLVGKKSVVVVVECYQGVHHEELTRELSALNPSLWVDTQSVFKSVKEIETMTYPYVTDDRLFGYRAHFTYADFLDASRVADARQQNQSGNRSGLGLWPWSCRCSTRIGYPGICGYGSLGNTASLPPS